MPSINSFTSDVYFGDGVINAAESLGMRVTGTASGFAANTQIKLFYGDDQIGIGRINAAGKFTIIGNIDPSVPDNDGFDPETSELRVEVTVASGPNAGTYELAADDLLVLDRTAPDTTAGVADTSQLLFGNSGPVVASTTSDAVTKNFLVSGTSDEAYSAVTVSYTNIASGATGSVNVTAGANGAWTFNGNGLVNGDYVVFVSNTDGSGNSSTTQLLGGQGQSSIRYDSTADVGNDAAANIDPTSDSILSGGELTAVKVVVSGIDADAFTNVTLFDAGSAHSITYNNIVNGTYLFDISGFNLAGSVTSRFLVYDRAGNVLALNGNTVTTICFLAGTAIRTPGGEVSIEALNRGDLVLTADGQAAPVQWLGRQTIARAFADPTRVLPIRIAAGALAEGLPVRDLLVSPDHALLVDGVLVHAGALVNGVTITRERSMPESFVYYHVELADHALVLAEGVPAETFIDNADRLAFDNWAEHEALFPQGRAMTELDLPRAKSARQVPAAIRARLAARAADRRAAIAVAA